MEWAGVGIIVGVQVATFLHTLRRMDALQRDIGEVWRAVGEVKERVARLEGVIIGRREVGNGALTQIGDD